MKAVMVRSVAMTTYWKRITMIGDASTVTTSAVEMISVVQL